MFKRQIFKHTMLIGLYVRFFLYPTLVNTDSFKKVTNKLLNDAE